MLILDLINTGRSRQVVCTPKEFDRLEGVCSAVTVLGFTMNNFWLIK